MDIKAITALAKFLIKHWLKALVLMMVMGILYFVLNIRYFKWDKTNGIEIQRKALMIQASKSSK